MGEQTAEMPRWKAISNWLALFVTPGIIVVCKRSGYTGWVFQYFCTSRNIALKAVIPGHPRSLGATERRRGHFRMVIDHMIGNKKANCLGGKEWAGFADMATIRLNGQVQKFDGSTHGQRVSGGDSKNADWGGRKSAFWGFYES